MLYANVSGGTNAGWKRPKEAVKHDWTCPTCASVNARYYVKCPSFGCRTERPAE